MNAESFEKALIDREYHIDEMSISRGDVSRVYGSVKIGNLTKQVRWDELGRCFSRSNARMSQFDLFTEKTTSDGRFIEI